MNRIIEHITQVNNGILPNLELTDIEQIIRDYPCFFSAYLLKSLALKSKIEENIFNEELPHLALKVQDRAKLYDVVYQNYFELIKDNEVLDKETEEILQQAEILKNEELEIVVNENINEQKEEKKSIPVVKKETLTKAKKPKTKKPVKKKEPNKTLKSNSKSQSLNEEIIQKPSSFVEWLKTKNTVNTISTSKENVPKEQNVIPIDSTMANEAIIYQESKKVSYKLEDFIVDQINKKQQQKSSKKDIKKLGISETYAQILEKQMNFEKAIQVYKELSIKYPEKSTTFASQIENLKNKL